jgi:hypothetical protein
MQVDQMQKIVFDEVLVVRFVSQTRSAAEAHVISEWISMAGPLDSYEKLWPGMHLMITKTQGGFRAVLWAW